MQKASKMQMIKRGVILAGGEGTRLRPLTYVTNKHLLPIYDMPMIMHPLNTLRGFGIEEVGVVTGGEHISNFMGFLGSGKNFGVRFTYKVQDGAKGIADALLQMEDFFKGGKVVAILGDNLFEKVEAGERVFDDNNAYIFIKKVSDPQRFGVVAFDGNGDIGRIDEKPSKPASDYAVTGLYVYPNDVFDFIRTLKPSARGELEITDVNNHYLREGRLKIVKLSGYWSDAGTFESLLKATLLRAYAADRGRLEKIDKELARIIGEIE